MLKAGALAAVLAAATWTLAGPLAAQENPRESRVGGGARQIVVSGHGEVGVVPDVARVSLGVEAEGETAQAALDAMSESLAAVMTELDAAGIAAEDRQTTNLSLYPQYSQEDRAEGGSARRIIGYQAQSILQIRVADIAAAGGLIDTLTGAGANRIDSISFDISDPKAATAKARRRAVRDARRKATHFANAAGVAVGEVLRITDGGGPSPRPMAMARMADGMESVPLAEGSITVAADVRVVFRIADAP